MNSKSNTYSTRRYFQRLLCSFLCISIIPLGACVIAILYANYTMSMDTHTKKVKAISADFVQKLDEAVFEYEKIADSIAGNSGIIRILEQNDLAGYRTGVKPLVDSVLTGRETRIRVHVLDADSRAFLRFVPEGASLYHADIFAEWGMLYELSRPETRYVLSGNPYRDESGRQLSLSLGRPVRGRDGELLGYVLVDIYRDTLLSLISTAEGVEADILLTDAAGIIVLDTTGTMTEGTWAREPADRRDISFLQALFGSKTNTHTYADEQSPAYGYSLLAYLNISDFYAGMELLLRISLLLFGITVVFCLAAAGLLARRLYEPVVEETRRQKDAEIEALQAQISPHFLYNMLNEIKALAKLGRTDEIADFVVHLGRLLRRSITYQEAFVEVRAEVDFINDYLALQQIRYERSFSIEMDIEDSVMQCLIPKLILQPIVENSIIHGFADQKKTHQLRISGRRVGERLYFEVYDDGVGVDEDYISYINNVEKGSGLYGGLGVENVQKRLLLTYGMEYGLQIESALDRYTLVKMNLPFEKAPRRGGEAG